jgi:hypothetical protein
LPTEILEIAVDTSHDLHPLLSIKAKQGEIDTFSHALNLLNTAQ